MTLAIFFSKPRAVNKSHFPQRYRADRNPSQRQTTLVFCEFVHLRCPGWVWPNAIFGASGGHTPMHTTMCEEPKGGCRRGAVGLAFLRDGGPSPGRTRGCPRTWHWRAGAAAAHLPK